MASFSSFGVSCCLHYLLFVALLATPFLVVAVAVQKISIDPSPTARLQTIEGWGTSLAWFANIVGGFPDQIRGHLLDLLFSASLGLNLNIVRYNIGGGSNPDPNSVDQRPGLFRSGAQMSGFWPINDTIVGSAFNSSTAFDWNADARQRTVLLESLQRGVTYVEAFSNSPPYWMTVSQSVTGHVNGSIDNLLPDHYETFALYLATVVDGYHRLWNVSFRTLDPFNEPSTNYWQLGGDQEGCHFDRQTQNAVLNHLETYYQELDLFDRGMSLSASDETSINEAIASFVSTNITGRSSVAQVNTHSYLGTARHSLHSLAEGAGKRVWMSEYGTGRGGSIIDIENGLSLAQRILLDMCTLQPHAWIYWQAIENRDAGQTWGLMQTPFSLLQNFSNSSGSANGSVGGNLTTTLVMSDYVTIGKQYYVMGQFSKFLTTGYTILNASSQNLLVGMSPNQDTVTLVVANSDPNAGYSLFPDFADYFQLGSGSVILSNVSNNASRNVTGSTGTATVGQVNMTLYRTSSTENLATVFFQQLNLTVSNANGSLVTVDGGLDKLTFYVNPYSVTTAVYQFQLDTA